MTAGADGSAAPATLQRMTPQALVNLVLRNAVPLVGIVFFHWSAQNLLLLYFVDTLLAIGVIVAGFLYSQFPAEEIPDFSSRLSTIVGYAAVAAFIVAIMAVPLGMPIFILVFGVGDASFTDLMHDPGFRVGLGLQAVASLVSFRDLVVALRRYTPEQLALKRRFALVFLRWVGLLMAAYLPITWALGRFGALLLVAVYVTITIYAEVRPDQFLAAFGDPDAVPGTKPDGSGAAAEKHGRWRRRRRGD